MIGGCLETSACSCDRVTFCEYMYGIDSSLVIRGKVIDTITYSYDNIAVYFQVEEYLRNDYGIEGEIIKIYGSNIEGGCDVNVTSRIPIDASAYLAVGRMVQPGNNPDSLTENYPEIALSLCSMNILRESAGVIRGIIDMDTINSEIIYYSEYPSMNFLNLLNNNCNFTEADIVEDNCKTGAYQMYPNPLYFGDVIKIRRRYFRYKIDRIEIYTIDGKKVYEESPSPNLPIYSINCMAMSNGIYIIRITSDGKEKIEKLVINR